MSKFGFDKILRGLDRVEKQFLKDGIKEAQKEFKRNFDTESDTEKAQSWEPVKRPIPPPILVRTGKLKLEATAAGRVVILQHSGTLTVDPIDEKGRGYAEYHQEGIGRVSVRAFITQSERLDLKQRDILIKLLDKEFL